MAAQNAHVSVDDYINEILKVCRKQASDLLKDKTYTKQISFRAQMREIETMKEHIHREKFFFVGDVEKTKLKHVHGVAEWLGYSNKDFTLEKYLSLIHPSMQLARNLMASN